jgi:hypothetical protein
MPRIASPIQRIRCTTIALVLALALPVPALAGPPEGEPATVAPAIEQPAAGQPDPSLVYVQPEAQPQPVPAPVYVQPAPAPQPTPVAAKPPKRGLGLTIAGFTTFGFTYLITVGVATVVIDAGTPEVGRPMLIPVAGPFIAASRLDSASAGFALGFTGVIQVAGLAMGIAGATLLGKSRADAKRVAAGPNGLMVRF